jgi:ATP-binding cassette subfamily B protein
MDNIKLLWRYMKGNRMLYIGSIVSIALATFFSIINPLIVKITIDSIIGGKEVELPSWMNYLGVKVFKSIIDYGDEILHQILIAALLLIGLTVLRGLFLYLKGKWSAEAAESFASKMRDRLYDHIQHLPYEYHIKVQTGDLIQRCTSDIDQVRRFLAVQFVEIGRAVFILLMVSSVMFSLHFKLALVSMAVVPIIFAFSFFFYREVKKSFKDADEAEGRLSTTLQENLTGVRVVRAFARENYEIEKFDKKSQEYRDLTYRVLYLLAWFWSLSDLLSMFQIGAVLILGVYWASIGGISLGTLVVFASYEGMMLWPVRQMGRILTDLGKTLVSLKRIQEVLDEESEKNETGLKPEIKGNIKFENVYFEYEKGRPVLKDVSFEVKEGQTVAILGPTGAGKSSLVHLLARLYEYQKGSIKINGVELKEIDKKWLRSKIGLVLQEPFLFARSIKENISLAKNDARDTEIFEAANNAAIHDVITGFENGYNTLVGEKGVSLSGGQKQRVAIARTLIRNCPILIFDDSLSAVDTETDAAIRKALKEESKNATTIIISHRINTLAEADLIIVLEDGQVVQTGTHQELVNTEGLYRRVWKIQNDLEMAF